MEYISNSSELAFNVTQMAGAISLVLADKLNHEEIIDQIELFDSETIYASIEYGQKQEFEVLLRAGHSSLLINMSTTEEAKSFLDLLVQLRDKFFELHKYSYVLKNENQYFRFEGTDEGEEACHPYYHLHIQEDGAPRIATHVVTPYDFLIFVADISGNCDKLTA